MQDLAEDFTYRRRRMAGRNVRVDCNRQDLQQAMGKIGEILLSHGKVVEDYGLRFPLAAKTEDERCVPRLISQ